LNKGSRGAEGKGGNGRETGIGESESVGNGRGRVSGREIGIAMGTADDGESTSSNCAFNDQLYKII